MAGLGTIRLLEQSACGDLFSGASAGRPVYLDVEADALRRTASLIWPSVQSSQAEIEKAFAVPWFAHSISPGSASMLDMHSDRASEWVMRTGDTLPRLDRLDGSDLGIIGTMNHQNPCDVRWMIRRHV